jgi:FtsH-binding integral membrane protein
MENNTFYNQEPRTITIGTEQASSVRTFLSHVFSYMAAALIISGVMAWWFGHTDLILNLYSIDVAAGKASLNILGWVVMLAPLGLVFAMGGLLNRVSGTALLLMFLAFSVINGISLSFIFLAYAETAIYRVFFMAAGIFAIMAVAGYTTKTDLTKLGSLLSIGLIGIVIGSLVNMFIGSSSMDYIISILGVIIFTGLTAYDMQKLKNMGMQIATGTETAQKMALMGALSLYLDFINLFLMLLRLFGGRRD